MRGWLGGRAPARARRSLSVALAVALTIACEARAATVTLEECARRAGERSPSIRAADFDVLSADAGVRAARASYLPRLEAHSEYGRSQGFDEAVTNGGSTAALLRLEATLLDGGRRSAEMAGAEARVRAATAVEAQRRADLLFEVRTSYFRTLAADREGEIHLEATETLENDLRILGAQAASGVIAENDVLRAELALAAERTAERATRTDADEARATLSSLAGVDLSAATLAEPPDAASPAPAKALLDSSPLLAEARAAVAAAEHGADMARSERAGQVTLSAEGGALGVRPGDTFEHDAGGQFLVGFTLPVFDGGVRDAHLAAALAEVEKARASLDEVSRTLQLSWTHAAAEARRAERDRSTARDSAVIARRHFELMRARHVGGGNVRLLEVLDALAQYVDARLGESRALLSGRIAKATEAQLLGEVSP
jgi:outer membrane protein TolC